MERMKSVSSMLSGRGARIMVLAVDNHASRLALKMACALMHPRDDLQVVTVVMSEESRAFGEALLQPFQEHVLPGGGHPAPVVLVKGDERLSDVITAYAESSRADVVVCGSHHLCIKGTRDDPMPATGSFALRLVKAVRCCPVLVVKSNNTGHYLHSGTPATGLRVMVDCQSNSRHLLSWLMDRLDPDKDGIFLAVTRAVDQGTGMVKETARRMITNFSVQASVSEYYTAQRLLKDPGAKALPQAAKTDSIDIIALQAPPCKTLPDAIIDVLQEAKTSVLVYNNPEGASPRGLAAGMMATVAEGDDLRAAQGAAA